MEQYKKHAKSFFLNAVESVQATNVIDRNMYVKGDNLTINDLSFKLSDYENVFVIGFGKASAYMAAALEKKLGDWITDGVVLVKYGHATACERIKVLEAGHPVPDQNTLENSKEVMNLLEITTRDDLVITLVTGGGSALFEVLPQKISFTDLQKLNQLLLNSGADINEINTVRRHVSKVKGGQLLRSIFPARNVSLIISDVMNDPLESIASGPTAADDTTFQDARDVIDKYRLNDKIPTSILIHLQVGTEGKVSETVKSTDPILKITNNLILGNIDVAMNTVEEKAREAGYAVIRADKLMEGEAADMGREIAERIQSLSDEKQPGPYCLIFGGETTVTHSGKGKGGRSQELALAALIELQEYNKNFALLSAGTDGTDGPTDAAGAIISNETVKRMNELKQEPEAYLNRHDSYLFFEKLAALIKTGPTGTNVMDLVIVLVEG